MFFCLFCGPGGPVGPNGLKKVKLSILSIGSLRSIGSFYSFDNRCYSVSFKSSFSVLGISAYSCHKPSKNLFCQNPGFVRAKDSENRYHINKGETDNVKYVHKGLGLEIIFDKNGKRITTPENIGTLN